MDSEGHLLAVLVEAADIGDRDGARYVFLSVAKRWPALRKVWADQQYTGDLAAWLQAEYGIDLEVVMRTVDQEGVVVLPQRWVVERSSAWMGRSRRLSKDYEHCAAYSESWIYLSSIHLLIKRLRPDSRQERPYARKTA